jgi:hypothetical protein
MNTKNFHMLMIKHKQNINEIKYFRISNNQKSFDITQSNIIYYLKDILNLIHTSIGLRKKSKQLN